MNNQNLIKLQHFFSVDVRIKKEMYYLMPPTDNEYLDEESICKYVDKVNDSLIYIFSELKSIAIDIFKDDLNVLKRIELLEENMKNIFYNCGLDINKLRSFYQKYISNMNEPFIDLVKEKCVGYTEPDSSPINMATSINEVLHFYHSYIMNNDIILHSIPQIDEKTNDFDYDIVLRGANTSLSQKIFQDFPKDIDVGDTDIISLNDKKALMMVRDRGHALTIEITSNNDIVRLDYFIPKICNMEMVNNLQGINKIGEDSKRATGIIDTDINNLSNTLFSFISKVPMDSDMDYNKNR